MDLRGCMVAALLGAAACEGQTGIVVDVSMSSALVAQLDPSARDFDTLRIYVGQPTTDATLFTSSDAFLSLATDEDRLAPGFRYLLEPGAGVAAVGPVMLAAAVGHADGDQLAIVGFAAAAQPIGFASGELRELALALAPDTGAASGVHPQCVHWSPDLQIAPPDDRDCDGTLAAADCDDRDPARNRLDLDQDGVTSCDGDCMEVADDALPWVDPADVHPGATLESQGQACVHVDYDCNGACGDATRDHDASGTTECGVVAATDHACAPTPADCDEGRPGSTAADASPGEACNGRDDGCDGFLPPPLPCGIRDGSAGCHLGVVACDEREGAYAGARAGALDCQPGGDYSDALAPPAVCTMAVDPSCLAAVDPIACLATGLNAARLACAVTARPMAGGACRPDRHLLTPPAGTPTSCHWTVVGGVQQAEWELGLVDLGAPLDAAPAETSAQCTPELAARASVAKPAQRTVLLLFSGGAGATVQPVLVQLKAGGDQCTGVLACTGSTVLPPGA